MNCKIPCLVLLTICPIIAKFCYSDDGSLIVMERAYYENVRSGFYTATATLNNDVSHYSAAIGSWFYYMQNSLRNDITSLETAQSQVLAISTSDQATTTIQNQAQVAATALDSSINDLQLIYSKINDYNSSLVNNTTRLYNDIAVVSNSFPTAITSTNLTLSVYVVVTNIFESCSNDLAQVQNSYTNFLNYYNGIQDEMLDQYRHTVTNLLDWSEFPNWLNYSYWDHGKTSFDSQYEYSNYSFWNMETTPVPDNHLIYPSRSSYYMRFWKGYLDTLPSDSTYSDFLIFSLQGIHDSSEWAARYLYELRRFIRDASSYTAASFPVSTSSTEYTNMKNWLLMPSGYTNQTQKIAASRNWFQRVELWLSSIAKNTDQAQPQLDVDESETRQDKVSQATNEFGIVSSRLNDSANQIAEITNIFVSAHGVMSNFSRCLDHFTVEGSNNRSGRNMLGSSGSIGFQSLKLMDLHPLNENLQRWTEKENSEMPSQLVVQDVENLSNAWSISLQIGSVIHLVMGIIWVVLGFGAAIMMMIFFAKGVLWGWFELIKFIPEIMRYSLGE